MPSDLQQLYTFDLRQDGADGLDSDSFVDIVAVHGLNETIEDAWTDPTSRILWLRDLLPKSIRIIRVLAYDYESSASIFFSNGCARAIQNHAQNLVTVLQTERSLEGCDQRPIIFICHGLGGILVKKALMHSSTQKSAKMEVYYSIFVSTYAIMFFGTPHHQHEPLKWLNLEAIPNSQLRQHTFDNDFVETFQSITDDFVPLLKQFHIYFFWEGIETAFGSSRGYVVEQSSAAPSEIPDTERACIEATHSNMVKFSSLNSSNYRNVLAALVRYTRAAPATIRRRWEQASAFLKRSQAEEAFELAGLIYDVHTEHPVRVEQDASEKRLNEYFHPPQEATIDFVGRKDVVRVMEKALFPQGANGFFPSQQQQRFIVHGMGGSGKTQTCCKFAKDYRERYWGIFTIRATSSETAKDSFAKIGAIGGLQPTEHAGRHWLSTLKKPWLLIIDNADDPQLDLTNLFPEGGRGHILVTTRNPAFRSFATAGSIELKGLKKKEAVRLLLKRADVPIPWDSSTEALGNDIARTLGYLALALIQAGTCIFRKICGLKDYLSFYTLYRARHRARLQSQKAAENDENFDIVYSTFDFSLRYLEDRKTSPSQDALDILNIVAFYHFEHIRVDIFTRAVENRLKVAKSSTERTFASGLVEALLVRFQPPSVLPRFLKDTIERLDRFRVSRALSELYSLSLISYDITGASFSLHPLVHSWARDRLENGEKRLWAQLALNTLLESICLPPDDQRDSQGDFKRDILPHLDACLVACPIKVGYSSEPPGSFQLAFAKYFQATLLLIVREQVVSAAKCGYVYAARGRFKEATEYLSKVKDTLVQILGYENEKTMVAMLGLAGVCWGLGELEEAISLQSRVVEARSKVLGPKHPETLRAMDQLGRSYWLHGQYHEALNIQQLTAKHMAAELGLDHDDTLAALDNLGVTLGSWHQYQESMVVHERVLASRKKRQRAKDLDTLTTMNNLAMALLDLGRLDQAKDIMLEVYEERKAQLGKEHPWTLWALCNLAKIKIELGLLDEAEQMLVEGIAAGKRSLSEDHLGVLMGCGELSRTYARQGRLDEAEKLSVDTVGRVEKSRGLAHPDSVFGLWKLAELYELKGDYEKAIHSCEVAIERINMRLTQAHPWFNKVESKLRSLRRDLKRKEESAAEELQDGVDDQPNRVQRFRISSQKTW